MLVLPDADDAERVADWVELELSLGEESFSKSKIASVVRDVAGAEPRETFVSDVWRHLRRRASLYSTDFFEIHGDLAIRRADVSLGRLEYQVCLFFSLYGAAEQQGSSPELVAVTHECDHPPDALKLTRVTRDVLPGGLSAAEIDAAVREHTLAGKAIYELDRETLAALEPDLIVTQALCPVCAVSYDEVAALARELPSRPRVIALDPKTLGETLGDVRTIAQATGRRDRGVELVQDAAARVDRIKLAVRAERRPRVAALESLDPVVFAGAAGADGDDFRG